MNVTQNVERSSILYGPLNVLPTVSMLGLLFSTKLGLLAAGIHCLKETRDVGVWYQV